ncbi:MAG: ElyC/SanA/YdcF family protein [Verrucomicrobiota bacterium]
MGFFFKKLVGYLLMPVPFATGLILAGFALRLLKRAPRVRRWLVAAGAGWLVLMGNNGVANLLVRPLERQFPAVPELVASMPVPVPLAACRLVVVLGSGHTDSPALSANNQLSPSGLARITEGVRLLRALPDAKLAVSGPARPGQPTHAEVLARAAVALGVARERIVLIDTARDTEDEAAAVKMISARAPVALVTSAWHLPRATALFRHQGVDVLPCPADFSATAQPNEGPWPFLTWDASALQRSTWAVRERIGWLWVWLRGKTVPAPVLATTK